MGVMQVHLIFNCGVSIFPKLTMKFFLALILLRALTSAEIDSCPLEDISYYTSDSNLLAGIEMVEDWHACAKICWGFAYPSRCYFWTYRPDKYCYMLSSDDGINVEEGYFSGDSHCF